MMSNEHQTLSTSFPREFHGRSNIPEAWPACLCLVLSCCSDNPYRLFMPCSCRSRRSSINTQNQGILDAFPFLHLFAQSFFPTWHRMHNNVPLAQGKPAIPVISSSHRKPSAVCFRSVQSGLERNNLRAPTFQEIPHSLRPANVLEICFLGQASRSERFSVRHGNWGFNGSPTGVVGFPKWVIDQGSGGKKMSVLYITLERRTPFMNELDE